MANNEILSLNHTPDPDSTDCLLVDFCNDRMFRAPQGVRLEYLGRFSVVGAIGSAWNVAQMAKHLGVGESFVRRHSREWDFTFCAAHAKCRGGTRGCDLRFTASEASEWINQKRSRRSGKRL